MKEVNFISLEVVGNDFQTTIMTSWICSLFQKEEFLPVFLIFPPKIADRAVEFSTHWIAQGIEFGR